MALARRLSNSGNDVCVWSELPAEIKLGGRRIFPTQTSQRDCWELMGRSTTTELSKPIIDINYENAVLNIAAT